MDTIGETRIYSGSGGGTLVFQPGQVRVHWNKAAEVAADPENRKSGITIATGKRQPPEFDIYFRMACAAPHGFKGRNGEALPFTPTPEMLETLPEMPVAGYAWHMLHAMANRDWVTLQKFTDATRKASQARGGAGIYREVVSAIETAAKEAGFPPTRKAVFEAWKKGKSENQIGGKSDLRDELGKLGFGWLAGGVRGKSSL